MDWKIPACFVDTCMEVVTEASNAAFCHDGAKDADWNKLEAVDLQK
jgi:hypothetical protein